MGEEEESDLDEEEEALVYAIRDRKQTTKLISQTNKSNNKPVIPRSVRGRSKNMHDRGALDKDEILKKMEMYGVDASKMIERGGKRERSRSRTRRDDMDEDESTSGSRTRSTTMEEDDEEGAEESTMQDVLSRRQAKMARREQKDDLKRHSCYLSLVPDLEGFP